MQILVYEFVTGGGGWHLGTEPPSGSLLAEGRLMLEAVGWDFAQIEGVQVHVFHDRRLPPLSLESNTVVHEIASPAEEQEMLVRCGDACDAVLVIAPEQDQLLIDRCRWIVDSGGTLIGPGIELVELASDKNATASHLAAAGIPVPPSRVLKPGQDLPADFPYPAVVKPPDGCGSQEVRLIRSQDDRDYVPASSPRRLERYVPGLPASVAVVQGPSQTVVLPPCGQRLSRDGRFRYEGAWLPLPDELAGRASRLAERVADALPRTTGYWGVDLVLGDRPEKDCVIEVNPRVTTSYVLLRQATTANLAAVMLQLLHAERVSVSFSNRRQSFRVASATEPDSHKVTEARRHVGRG